MGRGGGAALPPDMAVRSMGHNAPPQHGHPGIMAPSLTVSGPAEQVEAFRTAASGAGVIPWQLDLDRMEEDFFLRLAAPPPGQELCGNLGDAVIKRRSVRAC